ncbi:MAG: ABC transporter permease [Rhodopseudomonas palustris]|nr:ABC transporter permease [Rhodopseudomonas palustris]
MIGEFASLGTNLRDRAARAHARPTGVIAGSTDRGDAARPDARGRAGACSGAPPRRAGRAARRSAPSEIGGRRAPARGRSWSGSTAELLAVRNFEMAQGRFLPRRGLEPRLAGRRARRQGARASCSRGEPALGQFVRIGDRRFRVIGVLALERQRAGHRTPTSVVDRAGRHRAGRCSTPTSLFRILVEARDRDADLGRAKEQVAARSSRQRHGGEEDVTGDHPGRRARDLRPASSAPLTLGVAGIAGDQPGGGRHPDHERDAGRRCPQRTARDRPAQGPRRRGAARSCCAVPGRGGAAVAGRRRCSASLVGRLAVPAARARVYPGAARDAARPGRSSPRSRSARRRWASLFGVLPARRAAPARPGGWRSRRR